MGTVGSIAAAMGVFVISVISQLWLWESIVLEDIVLEKIVLKNIVLVG